MCIPLLNLMETNEERDGNEDDDGLLAVTNFELLTRDARLERILTIQDPS